MAQVNFRMDDDVKTRAEALFEELGLNLSTAINMFVRQSLREGGIPFDITTNRSTPYDEYFNASNMRYIEESIEQLKAGHGIVKTMAELEALADE